MRLYNPLKSLYIFSVLGLVFLWSSPAFAQNQTDAISGIGLLLDADKPLEDEEKKESTTCGPEGVIPIETCDIGQGVLCLNTPAFSTAKNYTTIHGTVDKRTSVFSHIRAYVQHDYTKMFAEVRPKSWASSDCLGDKWMELGFEACLDPKGFFGVKVPLSQYGPYTVMIDAVSVDGDAVSKTVRTSRVIAPTLRPEDITISPDPSATNGIINAKKINLRVNVLHDCTFCDFIGTSTGGVMITVNNTINTPDGDVKSITRHANISKNGVFDICVPVLDGKNELSVNACNDATGEKECPAVEGISIEVNNAGPKIVLYSPSEEKLSYDASYSIVPLQFSVENYSHPDGICHEGDVTIKWNHFEPVSLCPDQAGSYIARLIPSVGINVGTIDVKDSDFAYSKSFIFGWGATIGQGGYPAWVKNAFGINVGSSYVNNTIRPLINGLLDSDALASLIEKILSDKGATSDTDDAAKKKEIREKIAAIKNEIPMCSSGGGLNPHTKIELTGLPALSGGEIQNIVFGDSEVGFKIGLDDLDAHIKIFVDENGDGTPDASILPLHVAFKNVMINAKIKYVAGANPTVLLSSDNTDCDYLSGSYCRKRPSIIIPKNFTGSATKSGSFVRCDDRQQQLTASDEEGCVGLNILNAETGLFSLKVLEAVNEMAYCQGSAVLTYYVREKFKDISKSINILGKTIDLSGGLDVAQSKINIGGSGIGGVFAARFGEPVVFTNPNGTKISMADADPNSVTFALSTDIVNQLLYQFAFQKEGNGLFDWTLDEDVISRLGFNFVEKCDAFDPFAGEQQEPPALCQLRPKVGEMLGTSLTTNNYFGQRHPLRIEIKGSRRLSPHLRIYRTDVPFELPAEEGAEEIKYELRPVTVTELQVPDLEIAFYALEVDEALGRDKYGNPAVKLDENGNAMIHSMMDGVANVPILKVKATVMLALEVGAVTTSEEDTTKMALDIRPIPQFFRIVYQELEGGNSTIVPDESLLAAFTEKVKYGIDIYGKPENPIKLSLPKTVSLEKFSSSELFSIIGIEKLILGSGGLSLEFDHMSEAIIVKVSPRVE